MKAQLLDKTFKAGIASMKKLTGTPSANDTVSLLLSPSTLSLSNYGTGLYIPANVEMFQTDSMTFEVNARQFYAVVSKMTGVITIDAPGHGSVMTISDSKGSAQISGSWLLYYSVTGTNAIANSAFRFSAEAKDLMLSEVVTGSAAKNDYRPVLTGVNLKFGREVVELEAADGYQLGLYEMPYRKLMNHADIKSVVLSVKDYSLLCGALDKDDFEVTFTLTEGREYMLAEVGRRHIVLRVLGGRDEKDIFGHVFPPTKNVIPETGECVNLPLEDTLKAVRFCHPMAATNAYTLRIGSLENNEIAFQATHGDLGHQIESSVEVTGALPFALTINAAYLLSALNRFNSIKVNGRNIKTVTLSAEGSNKAMLLSAKGTSYRVLVMPMEQSNSRLTFKPLEAVGMRPAEGDPYRSHKQTGTTEEALAYCADMTALRDSDGGLAAWQLGRKGLKGETLSAPWVFEGIPVAIEIPFSKVYNVAISERYEALLGGLTGEHQSALVWFIQAHWDTLALRYHANHKAARHHFKFRPGVNAKGKPVNTMRAIDVDNLKYHKAGDAPNPGTIFSQIEVVVRHALYEAAIEV